MVYGIEKDYFMAIVKQKARVIELKGIDELFKGERVEYPSGNEIIVLEVLNNCKANKDGIIRPTVRPKAIRKAD